MNMINEVSQTKYVVKVNGVVLSIPFNSQTLAEQHVMTLSLEQRANAQVVPVVENHGQTQEILLG